MTLSPGGLTTLLGTRPQVSDSSAWPDTRSPVLTTSTFCSPCRVRLLDHSRPRARSLPDLEAHGSLRAIPHNEICDPHIPDLGCCQVCTLEMRFMSQLCSLGLLDPSELRSSILPLRPVTYSSTWETHWIGSTCFPWLVRVLSSPRSRAVLIRLSQSSLQ